MIDKNAFSDQNELYERSSISEMNEIDPHVVLTDEDGNDINFELLDVVQYEGSIYVVLFPEDDDEDNEVVILGYDPTDESFMGVDDDAIVNAVFELFKERNADFFDFVD